MSRPGEQESELPESGHRPMPGDADYAPEQQLPPPPLRPRRRPVPLPVLVLGVGVLVAILVVFAVYLRGQFNKPMGDVVSTPTPTLTPRTGTPAPVQHGAIGQRVTIQGLYGRGTVMLVSAQWSDRGDLAPDPGRQYLNLELRYDCTEGLLQTSNNFYAAYDTNKAEYLPGIGAGKDPLGDNELRAGQSKQGWVSMEMPPGPALVVISDEGINPLVLVEVPKP